MRKLFIFFLICACLGIVIACWKEEDPFAEYTGSILWTEQQDGKFYVMQYSFEDKCIIACEEGRLILNDADSYAVFYQRSDDEVQLFSLNPKGEKQPIHSVKLDNTVEIHIGSWTGNELYYEHSDTFMKIDEKGNQHEVFRLKGNDGKCMPVNSGDGKWAYCYHQNSKFYFDVIDSSGEIIYSGAGSYPAWTDENAILFTKKPGIYPLSMLSIENGVTGTLSSVSGSSILVNTSIFDTCLIEQINNGKAIAYFTDRPWKIGPFEMGQSDGVVMEFVDLDTGERFEFPVPTRLSLSGVIKWIE